MVIKAKYPALYRPYMQDVYQGYGGLSGGNTVSSILSNITDRTITKTSTGYMFGGQKLNIINYSGSIRTISITNESPEWLSNQSVSVIVELNSERVIAALSWNDVDTVWELTINNWDN